jgi:nitrogenase molybdenum-iron protein NifN
MMPVVKENYASSENPCKLCSPFGAAWAFAGIEDCVGVLHGSQGCSTYIRRYLIGHFREPVDLASTNFHESAAIFGGRKNLFTALDNLTRQYGPKAIGIATTCLAETIGDDMPSLLHEYRRERQEQAIPELIQVSTASYRGTHEEGFHDTVRAIVSALATDAATPGEGVNLIGGMISPADIRWLKRVLADFGVAGVVLPDYSDTLDGPAWSEYQKIPRGGTPLASIRDMGAAAGSVELTATRLKAATAAGLLEERCGTPATLLPHPVGVQATDRFLAEMERLSGAPAPAEYAARRGRLVDAYVDGHKYLFEKRAVIYGEQDLVAALAGFCLEVGVVPVLCATGGKSRRLAEAIGAVANGREEEIEVMEGVDFADIEGKAAELRPDLLIGNSNGAKLARKLDVPLLRVGMPVHDRIGAARIRTLGYEGTQELFDRLVNTIIEVQQESNPVGYTHM